MSNSTYNKMDYLKIKYNCQCGEAFSSLEELNEHTDFIIQHFI
jgi:hypothetical protein